MPFPSILFTDPSDAPPADTAAPPFFQDLGIDQIVARLTEGDRGHLAPLFHTPLGDPASVRYRHDVFRDLAHPPVRTAIEEFRGMMGTARAYLDAAGPRPTDSYRERLFLDGVAAYCTAVAGLRQALSDLHLSSRGLQGVRDHLGEYTAGTSFSTLAADTGSQSAAMAGVRYTVHIDRNRVRVRRYRGESDYGAEVQHAFSSGPAAVAPSGTSRAPAWAGPNQIEARILECVARLYPGAFDGLSDYCRLHPDPLDEGIERFDREVQFYLAYLDLMSPIAAAGLAFCYPEPDAGEVAVTGAYDLALACASLPDGPAVVVNDFRLGPSERVMVVTGPNQGGKTTFARMVGQLHYLTALGLPVPARRAHLELPDRWFTHFEQRERWADGRGKLEDELIRARRILDEATGRSLIVVNEGFASTTYRDARLLGAEVLRRVRRLGSLCVYVTFVDELAAFDDGTVSMVAGVDEEDPTIRTFRILRGPPTGPAYAAAIADRHSLGYAALRRRLQP